MLRHLLKLVWKRKGRNLMLSLEILIAFAIVFAVAALALRYAQIYHDPLGFSHERVWAVSLKAPVSERASFNAAVYDQFERGVASLPEVEKLSFSTTVPFLDSEMQSRYRLAEGGRGLYADSLDVSDSIADVLSIKLVAGRRFDQRDNGAAATPVLINRRLALALFDTEDAVGRQFVRMAERKPLPMMVTGVMEDFRRGGELAPAKHVVLIRENMQAPGGTMEMMLVKLAPGTTRQFEEKLHQRLKQIRGDWEFTITPLASAHDTAMRDRLTPLLIISVIAAFMLAMVAVGLFGVLWQNITHRIPEIGLRRAVGASASDIYRQIVGEQLLQSSTAMLVGLVLLVQLPLTGALGEALNWPVFAAAAVLSMATIYLLSLLCSLYPGWRASRLTPTEALHYE